MKAILRFSLILFFAFISYNARAQPIAAMAYKVIDPVFLMHVGDSFYTDNGKYFLVLQPDGNSVIYELATGKVLWSNYTLNADTLAFQGDGNFVAYSGSTPLWNTKTGGHSGYRNQMFFYDNGALVIANDGMLTWSSNPAFLTALLAPPPTPGCTTARQYAICVFPGTISQFNSVVLACSVADAARQAAASGASYGAC